MPINRFQIDYNRAAWRSIPSAIKAIDRNNIVSRVQICEYGTIAGILRREGRFVVKGVGTVTDFENLVDAEDFAVQQLLRDGGFDHE